VAESKVVIVGPSKSGKTCYLSTLAVAGWKRAAASESYSNDGSSDLRCVVKPINQAMQDLSKNAQKIVIEGRFPINATMQVSNCEFDFEVEVPRRKFLGGNAWVKHHSHVHAIDGPGGSIFGTIGGVATVDERLKEYREQLVSHAKVADGLLLCIDATDEESAGAYFIDLPDLIQELEHWPFKRLVILLTKAEKLVPHELGAIDQLKSMSAAKYVTYLIGPTLGMLRSYGADVPIACGWCSAFGFVPGEGTPNYNPQSEEDDQLLSVLPGMTMPQKIRSWEPFRMLEPLIYLASGERGSLELIE